ncbi:MAG: ATP-dependent sacrificial sulfur transferase LarE [Treponemataceae bacterium]|nr:ATP-dependent sacrificial sulfur transferase LarE [Treponemataceae bacterium]
MSELDIKFKNLESYLQKLGKIAVAFSGGTDSSFLLKTSIDVLGRENVIALTALTKALPQREKNQILEFCRLYQVTHYFVQGHELELEGFRKNPLNRCYLCKKEIFGRMLEFARKKGFTNFCEGSNLDDESDYRPGLKALEELKIISPLKELGFSKNEIRQLSKKTGLPNWQKASSACLYSRFAYGQEITEEKLSMIEKAEDYLFSLGLSQFRVRLHSDLARLEVLPEDFKFVLEKRLEIIDELKKIGFVYLTLDLQGFRSGSMNETLNKEN